MNIPRSRLRPRDLIALGFHGLRARPSRAMLSALGIAIGIAAMVAVVGISTSSQALVAQRLADLGTNLLTAKAGDDLFGEQSALPTGAVERVRRIDGVQKASATATLKGVQAYRNEFTDPGATQGLTVAAADLALCEATGTQVAAGAWLNGSTAQYPATVLGAKAAERLGVDSVGTLIRIGGASFTVVGILEPSTLTPDLDTTALVGEAVAASRFGFDGAPTTLYQRADDPQVGAVRDLLGPTINAQAPGEVKISRPSDALAAKNTIDEAFTGLLVGVGSIALLVGGIGVANTMVIAVIERRQEIGLRRSLGATRAHIRAQFLVEAMLLALLGGIAGTAIGWAVTAVVATSNGWLVAMPAAVLAAGVGVTVLVGAVAGAMPAARAAATSPTAALSA